LWVQLIVSDDHAGLRAARQNVLVELPGSDANSFAAKCNGLCARQAMRREVASDIRTVLQASDRTMAEPT